MFPTISQLANNLRAVFNYYNVVYNPHTCTFACEDLYEVPCYDSGGSVDSIGFESAQVNLTFKQAYDAYFREPVVFDEPVVAPVFYDCDDDLPF